MQRDRLGEMRLTDEVSNKQEYAHDYMLGDRDDVGTADFSDGDLPQVCPE